MIFTRFVSRCLLLFLFGACSSIPKNHSVDEVIFLHGANFNSDSWGLVIDKLKFSSTKAINLDGRNDKKSHRYIDLASSTKSLCANLDENKKYFFVVHSQGGAILHHSLAVCPRINIKGVLYISAVMPRNDQKVFQMLSKKDEENYFSGISYIKEEESLSISSNEMFISSFAGKVNKDQRDLILRTSNAEPAKIGEGVVKVDDSKLIKLKKYYIYTTDDKIISYKSQLKITSQFKFEKTFEMNSSHLPMVTRPIEVAGIIDSLLESL